MQSPIPAAEQTLCRLRSEKRMVLSYGSGFLPHRNLHRTRNLDNVAARFVSLALHLKDFIASTVIKLPKLER